ncbi:hypothetical protein EYC80_006996 [Monilinia laxa]|uniref:N-acetyltransferase domain-containing protein n=1 Tax=Monilinia laxa TaxID=61186 RepID=A0A5N6JZT3_MONLA|nr:hypothetical protein EYC80_006996 [Monilinia laxa]
MSQAPSRPHWARPSHKLQTPRLTLRSALPSDALPFALIHLAVEVQAQRLEAQKISTAAGKNAFLVIILKASEELAEIDYVEDLRVHDGFLIGMTGFNSFSVGKSSDGADEDVLIGDTGVLVDYRFARRGFAMESLCAVVEYGFCDLGCGEISLDTLAINAPFRGLMDAVGLRDVVVLRSVGDGTLDEEAHYVFNVRKWETAKKGVMGNGKWTL